MKILYQGNKGAYSQLAAVEIFPNAELISSKTFEECFKNGVMVRFTGNTIALSPPLIIDKKQIDHVFDVLSYSIKKCF